MITMPNNILLLSIRPEYANKIFLEKTKKVELRRVRTRLKRGDLVVVYVSSPKKVLVGSFEVERVIVEDLPQELNNLWKQVEEQAGIERQQFDSYYQGASVGVGIFFKRIQVFPRPLGLDYLREQLPNIKPPQSYRYLTAREFDHVESIVKASYSNSIETVSSL
jgi:predicted transcriptional regulator